MKVAPPGTISSIMDTVNSENEETLTVAELPKSKVQQNNKRSRPAKISGKYRSESHTLPLRRSKRARH